MPFCSPRLFCLHHNRSQNSSTASTPIAKLAASSCDHRPLAVFVTIICALAPSPLLADSDPTISPATCHGFVSVRPLGWVDPNNRKGIDGRRQQGQPR